MPLRGGERPVLPQLAVSSKNLDNLRVSLTHRSSLLTTVSNKNMRAKLLEGNPQKIKHLHPKQDFNKKNVG